MAFIMIILTCYFIVALIRKTRIANEWLPLISGGLGLVLSIILYFTIPTIVPDISLGNIVAYGFFCGLAATGSNQMLKQAVKFIKTKYGINISIPTVSSNKEDTNE